MIYIEIFGEPTQTPHRGLCTSGTPIFRSIYIIFIEIEPFIVNTLFKNPRFAPEYNVDAVMLSSLAAPCRDWCGTGTSLAGYWSTANFQIWPGSAFLYAPRNNRQSLKCWKTSKVTIYHRDLSIVSKLGSSRHWRWFYKRQTKSNTRRGHLQFGVPGYKWQMNGKRMMSTQNMNEAPN